MEQIKNKLPEDVNIFLKQLSDYINTPLYFYGSIQRDDYFPGYSDIDVDIFTDNYSSLATKLQQFLSVKKSKFKKIIWRLNNVVAFGHKIRYKNIDKNISIEFSIYNENIKKHILEEHNKKIILPFYITWLLVIIKIIYYKLKLMDMETFRIIKKKILSSFIGIPEEEFIVSKN